MDIFQSSLGREIDAILVNTEPRVLFRWMLVLHTPEGDYETMKVLNVDYDDNPEENFTTVVNAQFVMEAGTYLKRIIPLDAELEATVLQYPLIAGTTEIDYEQEIRSKRYRATLFDKTHDSDKLNLVDTIDETLLNITDIVQIQIQLIDKVTEQFLPLRVGGVRRKSTAQDVLVTMIQESYAVIDVPDNEKPIGVDVQGVSNTEVQETFVIPHGTRLVDLPDYIQNHCGGVFNSAMGSYYKDGFWYLYPKYDVKRFGKTDRTLTVIRIPPNKLPSSERTYRVSGDTIIILATSDAQKSNVSETNQLNEGNGVRFASSDFLLESFNETKDNKTTASRGKRVHEFLGQNRPTGINNAPVSDVVLTSNPYKQYSDVTQRQGNVFSFIWENANMDLIQPGMLVKLMVLEGEDVVEYEGVLLRAYHAVSLTGKGLLGRTYVTRSVLNIFTNALFETE